jgi:hypothetical protein
LYGVGAGLFAVGWMLLGVLAAGDRWVAPIPRNESDGDYV